MESENQFNFKVMYMDPEKATDRVSRTKLLTAVPGQTIAYLRNLSAEHFEKSSSDIHLIYFGKVLEDASTFEAAGIREGSTVLLYPKIVSRQNTECTQKVKQNILLGLQRLYKSKRLFIIARREFLERIYVDMPELSTSTFALLQSPRALVRCILPKHVQELDELAEKHPRLGEVLRKAIEWAPRILELRPLEPKELLQGAAASDEAELSRIDHSREFDELTDTRSSLSMEMSSMSQSPPPSSTPEPPEQFPSAEPSEQHLRPAQPSEEPQPGPSQGYSRRPPARSFSASSGVTRPMLLAALQAAYASQRDVATQTFGRQLAAMRDLGFTDSRTCIDALVRSGGDIDLAVNLLFQE